MKICVLEELKDYAEWWSEDFNCFFSKLPSLIPEGQLDEPLPCLVRYSAGQNNPGWAALNWEVHSTPYVAAFEWLRGVRSRQGDAAAIQAFTALADWAKAAVQKGHAIQVHGKFPPLLNGWEYVSVLDFLLEASSEDEFPLQLIAMDLDRLADNIVEWVGGAQS